MNILGKRQNLGIHHMPSEAIADIGILYEEFLDQAEKLMNIGSEEDWLANITGKDTQKAFDEYAQYSKSVEKKLKGSTSKDFLIDALINFRTEKTKILDNVLKKYGEGIIPSILALRLGTSIFKDTGDIKIIGGIQKHTTINILEMIKQRLLQIFKQK